MEQFKLPFFDLDDAEAWGEHQERTLGSDPMKYLCQNQRKYLETYLEDGRLPVSNNYCEANIKPFATARRAWLFADTPKGAFANGVLYTLVESARANELDVYEYLKYLLIEMPNNHHLEDPSVIDSLLPWSKELPEQCHLKRNRKKCLKH